MFKNILKCRLWSRVIHGYANTTLALFLINITETNKNMLLLATVSTFTSTVLCLRLILWEEKWSEEPVNGSFFSVHSGAAIIK